MVTSQVLLEGLVYALEQAGRLLQSATLLYQNSDYAGAVVFTAYAREEIGRSYRLRDLRKKVISGEILSSQHVTDACKDHVEKQASGQLSTVQRAESQDEGLGKLLGTKLSSHPYSQEWKAATNTLDGIAERQRKRAPNDRHELRMRALYVELNKCGSGWNRPRDIPQETVRRFLEEATNDYRLVYDHVQDRNDLDGELLQALQAWPDCPELPAPPRLGAI
jgi:AbiV family abortive infection protein